MARKQLRRRLRRKDSRLIAMILECWRHFGHIYHWNTHQINPYYENAKWAEKVRARAA